MDITLDSVDAGDWGTHTFTLEGIDYCMPYTKAAQTWEILAMVGVEYRSRARGASTVAAWLVRRGVPLPEQLLRDVDAAVHALR